MCKPREIAAPGSPIVTPEPVVLHVLVTTASIVPNNITVMKVKESRGGIPRSPAEIREAEF
jgi:hypothetical protein